MRLKNFIALLTIWILSASITSGQITGIKIAGDTCNSLTLDLQVLGTSSSPYFFWNFGDPLSGTNDTTTIFGSSIPAFPTHTFSGPGIYTICVSLQEPGDTVRTVCRTISIGLCCNGIIEAIDSCLNKNTSFSITTNASITSVSWNFGDIASGAANTSGLLSPAHVFSGIGSYTVTASATAPCGNFVITYPITIVNCPSSGNCTGTISLRDSCAQNPSSFNLNSMATINSVIWSFGDPSSGSANSSTLINPTHTYSTAGTYLLTTTAVASCGTITATYNANIVNCTSACTGSILFSDSCTGNNSFFQILVNSNINSVSWNFGDPTSGALNTSTNLNATHKYGIPGAYNVTATLNLACGTSVVSRYANIISCVKDQEECKAILPTGFTPNGDLQNDVFYVRSEDLKTVKTMRIYNRWGQLVYSKENVLPNDISGGWDGKYEGQICAPDIYMYYIEGICNSGKEILVKGDVMIIR